MKRLSTRIGVFLAVNILLLLLCLNHLPSVFQRPRVPFIPVERSNGVVVERILDSKASGSLSSGDKLLAWGGTRIPLTEAIEFLGDRSSIGTAVSVTFERNKNVEHTEIRLVPYYPTPRYLFIVVFVGFVIWGIAIFILLQGPPALPSLTLHWTLVAFAVTILITPGAVSPWDFTSLIERFLFFLSYMGVVALFLFFTLVYPRTRSANVPFMAGVTFIPALALVAGMSYFHLSDLWRGSLEHFESFQLLFDVFQGSLFVYMGGGILIVIQSYRRAESNEERRRLQWVIWGTAIGSAPFLFLHVLPQILFSSYLIPEEYATMFFLVVAFSYAISVVRYRFLDIELVINRSIVYGILTLLLLTMYFLVVLLFAPMLGKEETFEEYLIVVAGTLMFMLLLNPLRVRLQRVIDETLFATRVNFHDAVKSITEELHGSLSIDELYNTLLSGVSRQIPVGSLAVYESEGGSLVLKGSRGSRVEEHIEIPDRLKTDLVSSPLHAMKEAIRVHKGGIDYSHADWLRKQDISVCFALKDEGGKLKSLVTLRTRGQSDRFREEEMDLVATVCSQASEILERLLLQEHVILGREERRRMQEVSDLKSYFVSSVSHELRMPLTSIRMFAESLRHRRKLSKRTRAEYLEIIEGESERLSRLIGNVLDFSRIEQGVKEYDQKVLDPAEGVKRALTAMKYELKKQNVFLAVHIGRNLPPVRVDGDAFEEVVMNLLSNAIKYSLGEKRIRLSLKRNKKNVLLEVSDRGMGIPQQEITKIFDKFHRVRDQRARQIGGTGLGLSIVKHFLEAHEGTIEVRSKIKEGSTFRIELPGFYEKNSDR